MTDTTKPLVISAPEPRTLDLIFTPEAYERLTANYRIVEADPEKDHLLKSKVKPGAGSDSKKASGDVQKETSGDSMSKIAAGLKGLKIS